MEIPSGESTDGIFSCVSLKGGNQKEGHKGIDQKSASQFFRVAGRQGLSWQSGLRMAMAKVCPFF